MKNKNISDGILKYNKLHPDRYAFTKTKEFRDKESKSHRKSKVRFICQYCGKILYLTKSRATHRKFCSRECHYATGHTKESNEKNRQAHLGKKLPNRKKPTPFTKEHIENLRLGNIGKNKGCVRTSTQKEHLRQIALKQWENPELIEKQRERMKGKKYTLGYKHSDESNQKKREWNIANPNKKFKDTSIELKIEAELQKRNINYQKQVPLCKIAIVDFYLPDYNIIIQCDGCYWHNCPIHFPKGNIRRIEIDKKQDIFLSNAGFKIYRFWEHEINDSSQKCIDKINL